MANPTTLRRRLEAQLPNAFTILRVSFTAVLLYIWFFAEGFAFESTRFFYVLIFYSIAAFTDYLDGFFARYYNTASRLGKWLDPLADKIFVLSVFCGYLFYPPIRLWWWMVAIIAARELLVTLLRVFNRFTGFPITSDPHAKLKTFFQMTVQLVLFLMLFGAAVVYDSRSFQDFLAAQGTVSVPAFTAVPHASWQQYFSWQLGLPPTWTALYQHIPNILIFLTMCITVYSGAMYVYQTGRLWQTGKRSSTQLLK